MLFRSIQSKMRFRARKRGVSLLDFIVVMSYEVSQYYSNEFNLDESKIIVSPILQIPEKLRMDASNLELFANKYVEQYNLRNKKVLLFVGRLITEKALSLFISNVHSVLLEEKDSIFVIVGEGDEQPQLEELVKELRMEDKIIFVGRFDAPELYGWYLSASGFVLPSLSETFGAVVNESLIFGVPVLCSIYAGASSLINSDNGSIFDPKDKKKTIEGLRLFLDKIKKIENIDLSSKPSLMEDFKDNFKREWCKLIDS